MRSTGNIYGDLSDGFSVSFSLKSSYLPALSFARVWARANPKLRQSKVSVFRKIGYVWLRWCPVKLCKRSSGTANWPFCSCAFALRKKKNSHNPRSCVVKWWNSLQYVSKLNSLLKKGSGTMLQQTLALSTQSCKNCQHTGVWKGSMLSERALLSGFYLFLIIAQYEV